MYDPKTKHDPFADGRRIVERAAQWKKDNPSPPKTAQEKSLKSRRKKAMEKVKGPALRKGVKVYCWNGASRDEHVVIKKAKGWIYVDVNGVELKAPSEAFKYQMCVEYNPAKITWQWNGPSTEIEIELVKKIEGDWERTYDHTGKCVSMRLLETPWMLLPVHEFLTDEGYTVTKNEAIALQDINEHDWVDTYYWFCGACSGRKEIGSEVIKWMIGPFKEMLLDIVPSVEGRRPRIALGRALLGFSSGDFGKMVAAVVDKKITATMGKDILTRMFRQESVDVLLQEDKYKVSSGDDMIEFVRKVIEDNPEQIADLKDGKDKILGWLVGQVMKASKGKANAGEVNKMFREELGL